LWHATEARAGAGRPPPFWAFAWAGGQALARYVLDNPQVVRGKGVFDLASGGGIVAIAAALAEAREVTASEVDPLAIAALHRNAAANGVTLRLTPGDPLAGPPPIAEVILAGDVFYERTMAERVLAYLAAGRALGAEVLVGDPGRSYLPAERFERLAHYAIPVPRTIEDSEVKPTWVLRLG